MCYTINTEIDVNFNNTDGNSNILFQTLQAFDITYMLFLQDTTELSTFGRFTSTTAPEYSV